MLNFRPNEIWISEQTLPLLMARQADGDEGGPGSEFQARTRARQQ
jgi:hypothetical protein